MVRRNLLSLLACVAAVSAQPRPSSHALPRLRLQSVSQHSAQLIFFDGPGATQTYPTSINNSGTIAGFYADANGGHGFLRDLSGSFVTFDAPASQNIYPSSINSAGAVAGNYTAAAQHGFLRTPDGTFITFDVPGTFPSSSGNPIGLNDSGAIAGPYFDGSTMHGFLWTVDGSLTTIDAPESTYTYATGINAGGMVTGIYADASYNTHGFVRGNEGEWSSFDVPDNNFGFFPPTLSINDSRVVVGSYFQGDTQGFLWHLGASLIAFDVAGAAGTQPSGINSNGTVVGSYQDSSYTYHGFLRTSSGVVYTFSIPGAIGTFGVGINDSGVVAGSYQDATYASHGFLLIP